MLMAVYFILWRQEARLPDDLGQIFDLPQIILLILAILILVTTGKVLRSQTIPIFRARLIVSEKGLEYHWPTYHITCRWEDVDTIVQRTEMNTMAEILLLKNAQLIGTSETVEMRKRLGLDARHFIPLSTLEGWPTGKLADSLRQYAPQLFVATK